MRKSIVAFDTRGIKRYVFKTDKLREIRGASSLLDKLNRITMAQVAKAHSADKVYANGGSGQFLVASEEVDKFGWEVQHEYLKATGGGATVTFASIEVPDHITRIDDKDIKEYFDLLQLRLQEERQHPPSIFALPSHPFLRLCDSCGMEYANAGSEHYRFKHGPGENDDRYCLSCGLKRVRDAEIKNLLTEGPIGKDDYLWSEVISQLHEMGYSHIEGAQRPNDLNVFRNFKGAKEHIGLIYADANRMGSFITSCHSLLEQQSLADKIDKALYKAVCTAIARHLKIEDHLKSVERRIEAFESLIFPFDILLMGGDDVYIVVPASVAIDVALTIAETFYRETGEKHTLSASVILAPIKYPFGMLRHMSETAVRFAKTVGADARIQAEKEGKKHNDTRINFMIVNGGSSSDFKSFYNSTYYREDRLRKQEFYATLRPYAPDDLHVLLNAIRTKKSANLGRTKLHQLREAIFKMNLTTSVSESMAILSNWRGERREHIVLHVYKVARRFQNRHRTAEEIATNSLRVSFPWFVHEEHKQNDNRTYCTGLLDFIELYDLIAREEDVTDGEA